MKRIPVKSDPSMAQLDAVLQITHPNHDGTINWSQSDQRSLEALATRMATALDKAKATS